MKHSSFILHPSSFILLVCLLLSACSTPAPPPSPQPASTQIVASVGRTQPVASPTRAPTIAASATLPRATATSTPKAGALQVWVVTSEQQREQVMTILSAAASQAGIAINLIPTSPDSLSMSTVAGSSLSIELPDLIWGNEDDLFILQRAGLLQPAADKLDDATFLPATINSARADGKRWGTPIAARGALLLLYNKKLVSGPPTSSDELIVRAREATAGEHYGIVSAWVEGRWLEAWLRGFGSSSVSAGGLYLDSPAMVQALDLLKELRSSGPPPPSTYSAGTKLFREGKVAFAIDGDWSLERYRSYTETLDLGIAPLPSISGSGQPAVGPLGGYYLMQSRELQSTAQTQVSLLAQSLSSEAIQLRFARELGWLPAQRALLTSATIRNDPALSAAARYAELAPAVAPVAELRCAWSASEIILPYLFLDEMDSQQTATRLQQEAEKCMQENQ